MTIDPAVLVGTIGALGGLLVLTVRLFLTGAVLPRSAVPREDFDALKAINTSLVAAIPPLTEAVKGLTSTVETQRKNGNGGK